jgi:Holliday junction DNA helicase RuvB
VIDTRQVTFLMATTDPGRLREAFRSRLTVLQLSEYTVDEVCQILRNHRLDERRFPREAAELGAEALQAISVAGRFVPRQALQLLRDVSEAIALGDADGSAQGVRAYLHQTRTIGEDGLSERDHRYLRCLYPDQRKGLESLAVELGEDPTTIEFEVEPFLIRNGLVQRQVGGRALSILGQRYCNEQILPRSPR